MSKTPDLTKQIHFGQDRLSSAQRSVKMTKKREKKKKKLNIDQTAEKNLFWDA